MTFPYLNLLLIGLVLASYLPFGGRSKVATKLRFALLILCFVACFISYTPQKALQGAPFHNYALLDIAFSSCSLHLLGLHFCDSEGNRKLGDSCECVNLNALATISHCYVTAYPEEVDGFIRMCNSRFNSTLTRERFDMAHLLYEQKAKRVDPANFDLQDNRATFLNHPVMLNESTIFVYRDAYDQFLGNYNRSIQYGIYLTLYWIVVFGLVAVGNWSKVLFPRMQPTGAATNWVRKNISLPATVGKHRANEKRFLVVLDLLVPTRIEAIIVGVFLVLVVHFATTNVKYIVGDPFFHTKGTALARYYGVRSGVLASYLLPFSVLFAGRNNILQGLIRWEYSVFVMLHRWISRICVFLVVVHGICYSVYFGNRWREEGSETYVLWGIAATFAGVAILVQGLLVLRRKWYEAFLLLHIAFAALFMVGAWLHVKDHYFLWLYYLSVSLWVLDRALRAHRLCQFGFPEALVQLFEDSTLKVAVRKPEGFHAEGGGHCFLHFLRWSCFWQSHPFTYTVVGDDLVFYVKMKEGVTKSLGKFLETHPSKTAKIRVAVEGSYGEATPAHKYNTSVFVAGGNGIPGIFAEAAQVVKQLPPNSNKKVKLLWVVREYHSLLWFYEELLSLKGMAVQTEIFVTRPGLSLSPVGATDKLPLLYNTYTYYNSTVQNPIRKLKKDLEHVTFREGRPDMDRMVLANVKETTGSVCFVSCGHPIMVDNLRDAVVRVIGKDNIRVDYFEQLQVWA